MVVLESLGFNFARARACPLKFWEIVDGITFDQISCQDLSEAADVFGSSYWTVHRVDLHKELLRLALDDFGPEGKRNVTLKLSSPAARVIPSKGLVELEDGSTYSADLIVAADGLRSVVRPAVLTGENDNEKPHSPVPISTGLSAFRILIPTEALENDPTARNLLERKISGATLYADTTSSVKDRHLMWYECRGYDTQCPSRFKMSKRMLTVGMAEARCRIL